MVAGTPEPAPRLDSALRGLARRVGAAPVSPFVPGAAIADTPGPRPAASLDSARTVDTDPSQTAGGAGTAISGTDSAITGTGTAIAARSERAYAADLSPAAAAELELPAAAEAPSDVETVAHAEFSTLEPTPEPEQIPAAIPAPTPPPPAPAPLFAVETPAATPSPAPPVQIGRIEVVVAPREGAPDPFAGINARESTAGTRIGGGW